MPWRKNVLASATIPLLLASACTPSTRAACVPRLELKLRALDHLSERDSSLGVVRRKQQWNVTFHARLSWRTSSGAWP